MSLSVLFLKSTCIYSQCLIEQKENGFYFISDLTFCIIFDVVTSTTVVAVTVVSTYYIFNLVVILRHRVAFILVRSVWFVDGFSQNSIFDYLIPHKDFAGHLFLILSYKLPRFLCNLQSISLKLYNTFMFLISRYGLLHNLFSSYHQRKRHEDLFLSCMPSNTVSTWLETT